MSTPYATGESPMSIALSKLDAVKDVLTVKRVFGEAYQVDGVTVIPVATVRGGGGGGGGEGDGPGAQGSGAGGGSGFGVVVRPVGTVVVKEGVVSWSPTIDVTRVVVGGQIVAIAGLLVLGRVLTRWRHRRH